MPRPETSTVHPPLRWFADRADGVLSSPRRERLEAHLATGCASCAERGARLGRTLAALRTGPLDAPPRAVRAAAVRVRREARWRAAADTVRRIVATLVHDERAAPALALRAAPGDERRLLWTAGDWEIDVCVVSGASSCDVLGQVVRREGDAAPVVGELIAHCGRRSVRARLAADGRFALRGLAPGLWSLDGRVGADVIAVPPFVVERGD